MTSLLRNERRYVKRWANGTWGSAWCKFWSGWWHCVHILACLASFLSVRHAYIRFPGYMIHTWSSLATCFRSRSRKGGVRRGGTVKPVSFLVTRQLFTHTQKHTHALGLFFSFSLSDVGLSWANWMIGKEKGGGFGGIMVRGRWCCY